MITVADDMRAEIPAAPEYDAASAAAEARVAAVRATGAMIDQGPMPAWVEDWFTVDATGELAIVGELSAPKSTYSQAASCKATSGVMI